MGVVRSLLPNMKDLLLKLDNVLLENKSELEKITFQGDSHSVWDLSQIYNLSDKTLWTEGKMSLVKCHSDWGRELCLMVLVPN